MTKPSLPTQPLVDSDIHIWCAALTSSAHELTYFRSLLAPDEVARAGRFVFEEDRHRYIIGRGRLRVILGSYLQLEPAQLEFVYGPYGKPALKPGQTDKPLEFNVSHSKDLALYALNWQRRIGVDIEFRIPMADIDDFAERYFTARESAWINALAGAHKKEAFFKTWTCKEAFLKANGSGLTVPINEVEISLEAADRVELIAIGNDTEQPAHWRLELFDPFPGYQAAFAVEGHAGEFIFRQL